MSNYLPFINSKKDLDLFHKYYSDAEVVRMTLEKNNLLRGFRNKSKSSLLWIDAAFDGYNRNSNNRGDDWFNMMSSFPNHDCFDDDDFIKKPDRAKVEKFTFALLDKCNSYKPRWISIPQFPIIDTIKYNKVNRLLSEFSAKWKKQSNFKGSMILPLIFTNQKQLNKRTDRVKRIKTAVSVYRRGDADGFWMVDSSLDDQRGTGNFEKLRFPSIVSFFEEIKKDIKPTISIAGPYWGLNLILWARGLATHPAIGLGGSYTYHISGSNYFPTPKARVAMDCLKRWVCVDKVEFKKWLVRSIKLLSVKSKERAELSKIKAQLNLLSQAEYGRTQIAEFYSKWFKKLEAVSSDGRALALFQDFSSSFVLGKRLPDLPRSEGTARRPEKTAQQLMLNCL